MSDEVRTFVIPGGSHVFVVNKGPKGDKGDDAEDGDVTGPGSSVVGNIATFGNTDGDAIVDSGVAVASLATTAAVTTALSGKVDKVVGFGLSKNDLSDPLKAKLDSLSLATFRGAYADESTLTATVPLGDAVEGDYAFVVDPVPGGEQILYHWDAVNEAWTATAPGSTPSTGAEIKTALFAEADTNNLNDARLTMLNGAVQQTTFDSVIQTLTGGSAPTTNVVTDATTARTLTTTDSGKYIRLTNAGACTITIPTDAVATWTLFPPISFFILNTAPILDPEVGVTINDPGGLAAGLAAGDVFTLKKIGADEWDLYLGGP